MIAVEGKDRISDICDDVTDLFLTPLVQNSQSFLLFLAQNAPRQLRHVLSRPAPPRRRSPFFAAHRRPASDADADSADHPDTPPYPDPKSQGHQQGSTASLPLSRSFDDILPVHSPKRRPLPTPPSPLHHFGSIPSSPPPPYSRSLPAEEPVPMSRDLSRVPSAPPTTPGPEAPVILTPNEQGGQGRAPYDSFLCHSPPANTWIAVETLESEYSLLVRLPGFTRNGMLVFFLSLPVFFIDPPPP